MCGGTKKHVGNILGTHEEHNWEHHGQHMRNIMGGSTHEEHHHHHHHHHPSHMVKLERTTLRENTWG